MDSKLDQIVLTICFNLVINCIKSQIWMKFWLMQCIKAVPHQGDSKPGWIEPWQKRQGFTNKEDTFERLLEKVENLSTFLK